MWTLLAAGCLLANPAWSWPELAEDLRMTDAAAGRFVMQSGRVLVLEQFDVLAAGGEVVVVGADGLTRPDLGGLRLWRGTVEGREDSSVYVAVSSHFTNGFVRIGGDIDILSSGGRGGDAWLTDVADLPTSVFEIPSCEIRTVDGQPPRPHRVDSDRRGGDPEPPCRVAMLGLDTDWEFAERLFGGDANAAAAYALSLAGGISEIYTTNVNVRLQVSFLRVWSSDIDPYNPNSGTDMLDQFRNEWTANMDHIERNIAHMLTGRTNLPYGGVAWLSVICNHNHGYGVSGYLNGFFPYPLEDNNPNNWDLVVMAHELGHNFGTMHTHDGYTPPIDNCGNGDCTGAEDGTIMSYCHTCDGGISNIRLGFHERVQAVILDYLASIEPGCNLNAQAGTAIDDWAQTLAGGTVEVDVLLNDSASDCDGTFTPEIASYDSTSAEGGVVTLVPGGAFEFDRLAYTPPEGFDGLDTFMYEIQTSATATVHVDVLGLRAPDDPSDVEAGAHVDYYALAAPTVLPDFSTLSPYFDDVVSQIGFASTAGAFATSGRSDEVGAVFVGYVEVLESGLYTLSIESDDGSKMFIGEQLLINNDGIHAMVEVSGSIGLGAGKHAIRVEFFENNGGAGLIARIEGPGMPRQTIPDWAWWHDLDSGSCSEDVNGDGTVGVDDLLQIIGSWGPCSGCPADVDGSGDVGVDDLLAVLGRWGQDC
jgi:hypothetical protein